MARPFVGFYWTLPVHWAGFSHLPEDVDEAALLSKTIRYQRDLIRRYVIEGLHGEVIDEIVFLELEPDRASQYVEDVLSRALRWWRERRAELVYLDFREAHGHRPHPFISRYAAHHGVHTVPVSPAPLKIDGEMFDPIAHFRDWKRVTTQRQTAIDEALARAMLRFPAGRGRPSQIADFLNGEGVRTSHGKTWSQDNVRRLIRRRS